MQARLRRRRIGDPVAVVVTLLLISPIASASGKPAPPARVVLTKAASPDPLLPGGVPGGERALMAALFPQWDPLTRLTGVTAADGKESARLREAMEWMDGRQTFLAVLVERWTGDACEAESCPSQPTDLILVRVAGGRIVPAARVEGAGRHGGSQATVLDRQSRHATMDDALLGLRVTTSAGGKTLTTVRLYRLMGDDLRLVFERGVESTAHAGRSRKASGCTALVAADEFGTPPFPIKVTEHCTQTGKTSTELWRWAGSVYKLHGPASDAAVVDDDFTTSEEMNR